MKTRGATGNPNSSAANGNNPRLPTVKAIQRTEEEKCNLQMEDPRMVRGQEGQATRESCHAVEQQPKGGKVQKVGRRIIG